jgi:hypothetical protein
MGKTLAEGRVDGKTALAPEDRQVYEDLVNLVHRLGRGRVLTNVTESGLTLFEVHMTVVPPSQRLPETTT